MIAEESHEQLQEKQQASAINNSSELNKITTDITSPGLQVVDDKGNDFFKKWSTD